MRNYFALLLILVFAACSERQKQDVPDNAINKESVTNPATASGDPSGKKAPVMEFEKLTHDFGTITEGEKVSYAFRFKNTGNTDLVIRSASGSCGCTVPEYPKDPVAPGKEGVINVSFDSQGRTGMQHKEVTIIANTVPNTTKLSITGEVIKQ